MAAWGVVAGCALPYQPATVALPGPADAATFERIVRAVELRYPRLEVVDPQAFRLQSAWQPMQDGDVPGQERATVFLDGEDRLAVVVEIRWLRLGTFGTPAWTAVEGDPDRERVLLDDLESVLGLGGRAPAGS